MFGAIFDFNGTLFFDTDKHQEAWRKYGEQLLGRPVSQEEFQVSMLGRNNRLILQYLLGRTPTPEETAIMGDEKEACYRRLCLADPETLHLAPGASEFLDRLKAAKIPVTIATSSGRENLDFYFEQFGLDRWFRKELCVREDGTFAGKPAPDIYLRAAERLGLPPARCTVFEDAISGIRAAHSAGAGQVVAVASSMEPAFFADTPGVTLTIRDYFGLSPELLRIL